jgi:hypothetical protein
MVVCAEALKATFLTWNFFGIDAKVKRPEAFPGNYFSMPAAMFFMLAG